MNAQLETMNRMHDSVESDETLTVGDVEAFVASLEFFRQLKPGSMRAVVERLRLIEVREGQRLHGEGDIDENLYILYSGLLGVMAGGRHTAGEFLTTMECGEIAGGLGLLSTESNATDVIALKDSQLLRLSRAAFQAISAVHSDVMPQMMRMVSQHFRQMRLLFAIHVSRIFGELDEVACRDLGAELKVQLVRGGGVLFEKGDPSDSLYIVVSGRLRAVECSEGGKPQVTELGVGENVGTTSLVTEEPRTASVYAIRDSEVARLSRSGLDRFLVKHPRAVMQTFAKQMFNRLKEKVTGAPVRRRAISTVAIVPMSADVDVSNFCEKLARSMGLCGSTLHLTWARLATELGNEKLLQGSNHGVTDLGAAHWLSQREAEYDYILYEANATPSSWTRRCIRQADLIVLVGNAAGNEQPSEVERTLLASASDRAGARISLALLHPDSQEAPENTKRWLDGRQVERHYHVRMNRAEDYDRLARCLLGKAVGLVLGGGFARGIAHIGVMRAMRELGIEIDIIGGTSMGGLMAAGWASGLNENELLENVSARGGRFFHDLTLPLVALQHGSSLNAVMKEVFGKRQIEDLWIPFFCISTNLNQSDTKVHTQGEIAKAVLATTRAPAIFPPIVYDGELHVDGGLLNNVPVDVMRQFIGEGTVIGVDVSSRIEFDPLEDYGAEVSGWRIAWNRINPFGTKKPAAPSMLQVLLRTLECGGYTRNPGHALNADLYLRPPVKGYKGSDFHAARPIAQVGYEFAIEKMLEWRNARCAA